MAQVQNKNQKNAVSLKNTANRNKGFSVGMDNSGVSAVIGVILMVAITVILAAIIGVFVMNLTSNVPKAPGYAAFSVDRADTGAITIKNLATTGEPIQVVKVVVNNGLTSKTIATGTVLAPLCTVAGQYTLDTTTYTDLKCGSPTVANDDGAYAGSIELTIIGQTEDGGENILQTFNIPACPDYGLGTASP